jgi:hypothetical protein
VFGKNRSPSELASGIGFLEAQNAMRLFSELLFDFVV